MMEDNEVDFILVWKEDDKEKLEEKKIQEKQKKRYSYLKSLFKYGLQYEDQKIDDLHFIKIHAPLNVLTKYCWILKVKLPLRKDLIYEKTNKNHIDEKLQKAFNPSPCKILENTKDFPPKEYSFKAPYSEEIMDLFDLNEESVREYRIVSQVIQFILERARFSKDAMGFGINRLLTEEVFIASYPLHDGLIDEKGTLRNKLYNGWGSVLKFYRYQPIDYIKDYFGVKIGLYFAWLGFYTKMLLVASIVGISCFLYSICFLKNSIVDEICDKEKNITMCPLCDSCEPRLLSKSCNQAKIKYFFDNPTTVFYAVFMSLWATLFLELWKRRTAVLKLKWNLSGFCVNDEQPRPEYLVQLEKCPKKTNFVTCKEEPDPSFWKHLFPHRLLSISTVILLVALCLAAVVSVAIYRMVIKGHLLASKNSNLKATIITSISAASINLLLISPFNKLYSSLAVRLTDWEHLRTQTEFDDSFTLKLYLLQFVNYYSSIFYLAFFKGRFVGSPINYERVGSIRLEACGSAGCLMEVSVQLAVIMVGKQALNALVENLMPIIKRAFNKTDVVDEKEDKGCKQWLHDYNLIEWGQRSLFPEYLEMVVQYGFVTLFVVAFPLAPFFALLNNIFELRLDAKKLLTHHRRPVSESVTDIGVWYGILHCVSQLSVITNGLIIAFTSDFIPRLEYLYSHDGSLESYLDSTLSYHTATAGDNSTLCRYVDYREPPWVDSSLRLSAKYWKILALRIAFVVIFQNVVNFIVNVISFIIPDMPENVSELNRAEEYIVNDIIMSRVYKDCDDIELSETEYSDDEKVFLSVNDYSSLHSNNINYVENSKGSTDSVFITVDNGETYKNVNLDEYNADTPEFMYDRNLNSDFLKSEKNNF